MLFSTSRTVKPHSNTYKGLRNTPIEPGSHRRHLCCWICECRKAFPSRSRSGAERALVGRQVAQPESADKSAHSKALPQSPSSHDHAPVECGDLSPLSRGDLSPSNAAKRSPRAAGRALNGPSLGDKSLNPKAPTSRRTPKHCRNHRQATTTRLWSAVTCHRFHEATCRRRTCQGPPRLCNIRS